MINKCNYRYLFEQFLVFSVCGWLYEVIWCGIIDENIGFVNRGFLFGPWLPIYGFGMLFILFISRKTGITQGLKLFLLATVVVVLTELAGSYFMELATGSWLWDYTADFANFEGRIALKPDLYLGALGYVGVRHLYPQVVRIQDRFGPKLWYRGLSIVLAFAFVADTAYHFYMLTQ